MAGVVQSVPLEDRELLAGNVRVPAHAVYRAFPSETVVLNLNTGRYHGLNATAGRMLELLDAAPCVREAVGQIAREYRRELLGVRSDVCGLCRDLLERGLLEFDGPPGA
jgi:hypothetical protein